MTSLAKALASYKTIGIDSLCFIYYFEANDTFGETAKTLFSALNKRSLKGTCSVLVMSEILAFEHLQSDSILYEKTKIKLRTTPNVRIVPIDETIAELAAIIKVKYHIELPDGIHIATAIVSKQDCFITNDKKLKKITELPVLILSDFV